MRGDGWPSNATITELSARGGTGATQASSEPTRGFGLAGIDYERRMMRVDRLVGWLLTRSVRLSMGLVGLQLPITFVKWKDILEMHIPL
jgi:hypothetical protein